MLRPSDRTLYLVAMMLAYLDQNILGDIHEGKLHLSARDDLAWLYSTEHFAEISRGSKTSLLSVLEDLKAREIEVVTDSQWRTLDQAIVHEYASPVERYKEYLQTVREVPFDETILTCLIARLGGAANYEDIKTLPERIESQLEMFLGDRKLAASVGLESALMGLVDQLKDTRPLESLRKSLGTDGGRVGKFEPRNAIRRIWDLIEDQCGDFTAAQFFGFDPAPGQLDGNRATHVGIIACHYVLNLVGYRPDKGLSDQSTIPNILSDGRHIANAAFCQALVSADHRLCYKASAIYKYLGIGTVVADFSLGPTPV